MFLQAFVQQAATAIEKAQFLAETEHRLTEVTALYSLANQITRSLELECVLETIVEALRTAIFTPEEKRVWCWPSDGHRMWSYK
jgi:hypothetical protein